MTKYELSEIMKVLKYLEKNCKDVTIGISSDAAYGLTFKFETKDFNDMEIKLFPENLNTPAKIKESKNL